MGEASSSRMMKSIGFCCSFVSAFGVILLAVLHSAESNYTHNLGVHCKSQSSEPCTIGLQHKNQEDAASACMTAMIFYIVTFVLSLGCIFGANEKEEAKLIM